MAAGRGGTAARWTLAGTATVSESAERGRGNTEDKRGSRDEPAPKVAEAPAVAGASADQRMGLRRGLTDVRGWRGRQRG